MPEVEEVCLRLLFATGAEEKFYVTPDEAKALEDEYYNYLTSPGASRGRRVTRSQHRKEIVTTVSFEGLLLMEPYVVSASYSSPVTGGRRGV